MSEAIPIPTNWLLPLFWAVVDGSQAGNLTESQPALLVGQAFCGGDASVAPLAGINGNGVLTLDANTPVLQGSATGLWKVVFTSPTAFTVTPPVVGMAAGAGQVGQPYAGPGVKFSIAAGSNAFAPNDEFDVTVNALPTGTAAYNVAVPVGSLALAQVMFGIGSMLERMVNVFLQGNTTQQLWALPIPKPTAGIKAAGTIGILTAPTSSGILTVYIAGQKVQVTVYSTDTQASVAANLAAAINALPTLPVTAAVDATVVGQVDLTCRWHGLTGNDVTIVPNYGGVYARRGPPGRPHPGDRRHGGRQRQPELHGRHRRDPVAPVLPRGHALLGHGLAADLGRRDGLRPDRPLGLRAPAVRLGLQLPARHLRRAPRLGPDGELARHLHHGAGAGGADLGVGVHGRLLRPGCSGPPRRPGAAAADAWRCRAACPPRPTCASRSRS